MINFLKNYLNSIKKKSLGYKIIFGLILIFYIVTISLTIFKTNYYMTTPGTVSPIKSVIDIESDYSTGNVYTVSVFETRKISILNYLMSKIDKNVVTTKMPENIMSGKNEDIKGLILKQTSINQSLIVAYLEAQKTNPAIKLEYDYLGLVVCSREENVDNDLKLEDIITHVNSIKVTSRDHLQELVTNAKDEGSITLTVLRDGKIDGKINDDVTKLKSHNIDISLTNLSIGIIPFYDIDEESVAPSYTINENNVQGPSGGLMQTIAIYNAITKSDITKGKIIMGTGTIDIDGAVGIIGGEQQKVITANLYSADIFFVPEENYNSALEQYQKLKNPNFNLVMVKTFADALQELERME